MKEKYDFEDASNEANALQNKVESGEADSYSEAEEQQEIEKNENSLERILPGIDMQELTRDSLGVYCAPKLPKTNDFDNDFLGIVAVTVIRPSTEKGKRNQEKLRSFVENKILLDTGAGSSSNGYRVARALGARAYIGVEPFVERKLHEEIRHDAKVSPKSINQPQIPFAVVKEGLSPFLKRLPDNSVCVLTSGIDVSILGGFDLIPQPDNDYEQLQEQLARVIGSDGVQLSFSSDVHPRGFNKEKIPPFDVYKKEL